MLDWKQINGSWYCYQNEIMVKGWIQDSDKRWYYLNPGDGKMATEWIQIDSRWYYLYPQKTEKDGITHYTGEMATGWIQINSIWYYLYHQKIEKDGITHYTGEMAVNTIIDGWTIDSNGVATLASNTGSITDNAKYIYSFFRQRNWTINSICGMLGNMQGESGIVSDMDEIGGGGGYGLVQWTPKSMLTDWAKQNGLDYKTLETQCKRIQWELENSKQFFATNAYQMSFKQFTQSTNTPTYLAAAFINNYERPTNANQPQRGIWAEQWYNTLVK